MINEKTLLERLYNPDGLLEKKTGMNKKKLIESIVSHLHKLLNTRQGSCLIQPSYGMPDFSKFKYNLADSMNQIEKEIQNCIKKYEPRLKGIVVTSNSNQDDPLHLFFEIVGELSIDDMVEQVWFETKVDSQGLIKIKG